MKKFRFLFLVLALILVVGMTTGLIVRKQTGGQTVMQHSNAAAPASTTAVPASTSLATEAEIPKIPVTVENDGADHVSVLIYENGSLLSPSSISNGVKSYYVIPGESAVRFEVLDSNLKADIHLVWHIEFEGCTSENVEDPDIPGIFSIPASATSVLVYYDY